jgi:hypothetical protein
MLYRKSYHAVGASGADYKINIPVKLLSLCFCTRRGLLLNSTSGGWSPQGPDRFVLGAGRRVPRIG